MSIVIDPNDGIRLFAEEIVYPRNPMLGLAFYSPEDWARQAECFDNVNQKVCSHGGDIRFGWVFHYRLTLDKGGNYLFATHHAVWHAPNGNLVDVTPFHADRKHQPIVKEAADTHTDGVVFLVDEEALPVKRANLILPLPMRFFPLSDNTQLVAYVDSLNVEEQLEFEKSYGHNPNDRT